MGTYSKTSIQPGAVHAGKAIYQQDNGARQYMFWVSGWTGCSGFGCWVIGAEYAGTAFGVKSKAVEQEQRGSTAWNDNAFCPDDPSEWAAYGHNGAWNRGVFVVKACTAYTTEPTCPSQCSWTGATCEQACVEAAVTGWANGATCQQLEGYCDGAVADVTFECPVTCGSCEANYGRKVGNDYQICDHASDVLDNCKGAGEGGPVCTFKQCLHKCGRDPSCKFFYFVADGLNNGRCKRLNACPTVKAIGTGAGRYQIYEIQHQA